MKRDLSWSKALSDDQRKGLNAYVHLLDKWRFVTNLISTQGFESIWQRHIWDCVALCQAAPSQSRWLDIGSGAGLPGIVIGLLTKGEAGARVCCVESDGRKCAFLRIAVRELDIPVKVFQCRAEVISPLDTGPIDVVTARAFSSIPHILSLARPFLANGAFALLPRGESYRTELADLNERQYRFSALKNAAAPESAILQISKRG